MDLKISLVFLPSFLGHEWPKNIWQLKTVYLTKKTHTYIVSTVWIDPGSSAQESDALLTNLNLHAHVLHGANAQCVWRLPLM